MSIGITKSSPLNWFREDGLIALSASELRGENLRTGVRALVARQHDHPRSLVSSFEALHGEFLTLRRQLFPRGWTSPHVVLCLDGLDEGGYTAIEIRALREAALAVGLRKIWLVSGPLVAAQARQFFAAGGPLPGATD